MRRLLTRTYVFYVSCAFAIMLAPVAGATPGLACDGMLVGQVLIGLSRDTKAIITAGPHTKDHIASLAQSNLIRLDVNEFDTIEDAAKTIVMTRGAIRKSATGVLFDLSRPKTTGVVQSEASQRMRDVSAQTASDAQYIKLLAFTGGAEFVAHNVFSSGSDVDRFHSLMRRNYSDLANIAQNKKSLSADEVAFYYGILQAVDKDRYPAHAAREDKVEAILDYLARRKFDVPKLVAKINSSESVDYAEDIIDAADIIVVDREQLSTDATDNEYVPTLTAMITKLTLERGKPVVVASGRVSDDMRQDSRFDIAEMNDIHMQVIDNGAHALMPSGDYESEDEAKRSIDTLDDHLISFSMTQRSREVYDKRPDSQRTSVYPTPSAKKDEVAYDIVMAANEKYSKSGRKEGIIVMVGADYEAVRRLVAYRPLGPVFVADTDLERLRKLSLFHSVHLLHYDVPATVLRDAVAQTMEQLSGYEMNLLTPEELEFATR